MSKPSKPAVRKHGPKAPFSFRRNIMPALVGIGVMLAILAILNMQWLIAQFHYRTESSQFAIAAQVAKTNAANAANSKANTTSPNPSAGPLLTIPAIGVDAPVEFGQGTAEWQIQIALRSGVVHYDNSVKPGEAGNVAIFGHSSGQAWAPGKYKFVFTLLNKLQKGDIIYLDYNGTRYTYEMTGSEVVSPTDVGILKSGTDHELTLITCTPVGTSTNRLAVHAEQISPAPNKPNASSAEAAAATNAATTNSVPKTLPGSASGSIWSTIKSWF